MKILVLNGSPKKRKESDTAKLTYEFLSGMNEEAEWIDVIEKNIAPCTGCFYCRKNGGTCALKDDMTKIIAKIMSSDLVIWSTPQYAYGLPSHMKALLDRLLPLFTGGQNLEESGKISLIPRKPLPEMMLIAGLGFADSYMNREPLDLAFEYYFGKNAPRIVCAQSPLLSNPSAKMIIRSYLKAMRCAGEEYSKSGVISKETLTRLDQPISNKSLYLKMINMAAE